MKFEQVMSKSQLEREIIEQLRTLSSGDQQRVLRFIITLQDDTELLSANDLMQLPLAERNRRVQAAIESAADEDFEIFEAYSDEST
jgi:hypothetical protein